MEPYAEVSRKDRVGMDWTLIVGLVVYGGASYWVGYAMGKGAAEYR